jgi:hypothetical protein
MEEGCCIDSGQRKTPSLSLQLVLTRDFEAKRNSVQQLQRRTALYALLPTLVSVQAAARTHTYGTASHPSHLVFQPSRL